MGYTITENGKTLEEVFEASANPVNEKYSPDTIYILAPDCGMENQDIM